MPFTFDKTNHVYRLDGAVVPSVTGVLHDNRMLPDYSMLDPFYRERGTAVHTAMALEMHGRLDWDTLDENVRPHIERGCRFLDTLSFEPMVIEMVWVDPIYRYGGTLDLFARTSLGPILLDWKTGGSEPAHGVQAAGGYLPLLELAAAEGAVPVDVEEVRAARVAVVSLDRELPKARWIERDGQQEIFRAALAMTTWRRRFIKEATP